MNDAGGLGWKLLAEFLSLASSLCLIFPALALNRHLRAIKSSQDKLNSGATVLSQAIAAGVKPVLQDAQIPSWSRRDQRLLVAGIAGLLLASIVRFGALLAFP